MSTTPASGSVTPARTVLITGTSSGIGLAAAIAAARAGWRTVATLRDTGRADALRKAAVEAGVEIDIRQLDVVDETSVTAAVEGVIADYGRWTPSSTTQAPGTWALWSSNPSPTSARSWRSTSSAY